MQTESNIRPSKSFEIENIIDGKCDVVIFDNIQEINQEIDGENVIKFVYDIYRIKTTYRDDLETDLLNDADKLLVWKQKAVEIENSELASEVRKKRDELLSETDKEMCFDRLGFEIPATITATTMLSAIKNFFSTLKNISNGDMAKYRQELRDITTQEGFPRNVIFPDKPKK